MKKHLGHQTQDFSAKRHLRELVINSLFTDVATEARKDGVTYPGSQSKLKT